MRPITMLTFAAVLALASAAAAKTTPPAAPPPVAPATDTSPLPPVAEDQARADAMTAQLAQFDARIRADELRMTDLRNAELAAETTRLKAIKPALPLHGTTWVQFFP
jgi:hypothetical protein